MIPPILEFCRVDRTTIRLHRILALLTYFVFACAGRAQVLTCGTAYWKFGYVGNAVVDGTVWIRVFIGVVPSVIFPLRMRYSADLDAAVICR